MKSLEIINTAIKEIEEKIYKLDLNKEGTINEVAIYILNEKIKEHEQVKQDLEVLEILKKAYIEVSLKPLTLHNLVKLDFEAFITKEEFEKIKQWSEERE